MPFFPVLAYAEVVTLTALLAGHSPSVLTQEKMHKHGHMNHQHMKRAKQPATSGKHMAAAKLN